LAERIAAIFHAGCVRFLQKGGCGKAACFFFPLLNQSALLWYESLAHPALFDKEGGAVFLRPDSEMVAACTKTAAAPLGTDGYRHV